MPSLTYTPPGYTTTNVVYGTGVLLYAPPASTTLGASVPGDANLGVYTSWSGLGWAYVGAVLDGVTLTYAPTTQDIVIEEQPTPVGRGRVDGEPDDHRQHVRGNPDEREPGVG